MVRKAHLCGLLGDLHQRRLAVCVLHARAAADDLDQEKDGSPEGDDHCTAAD
jgi:hypothetical protein